MEKDSINLSDIKSENESIYWDQKRGTVLGCDILLTKDKLFDEDFIQQFRGSLEQLHLCLEDPHKVVEQHTKDKTTGRKRQAAGHN